MIHVYPSLTIDAKHITEIRDLIKSISLYYYYIRKPYDSTNPLDISKVTMFSEKDISVYGTDDYLYKFIDDYYDHLLKNYYRYIEIEEEKKRKAEKHKELDEVDDFINKVGVVSHKNKSVKKRTKSEKVAAVIIWSIITCSFIVLAIAILSMEIN